MWDQGNQRILVCTSIFSCKYHSYARGYKISRSIAFGILKKWTLICLNDIVIGGSGYKMSDNQNTLKRISTWSKDSK